MYYILSLTFFLFLEIAIVLTQGNDCHLKNGAIGMCIPYNQCDDRLIESRFGTPSIPVSCDNEKICCRHASTAIVNEACKYYIKKKSMITPQILRGTDVAMGEYPHMAALGYYKDTGLTFDCGGTLISETFVLTAAHCIFNKNDKQPSLVRMGTIILNGTFDTSSTDYNISEIITHHYYNRLRRINDIALLRLVRPVKLSTTIFPACLETSHVVPSVDATPMVAGWGNTVAKGDAYSNTLLKTSLKFVNDRECSEILSNGPSFRKHFPLGILRTQLCAKGNISDTCQGDSGGPLKVPYENIHKVIGVTSFGTICGSSVPGVYTKVSAYLTWISKIVWPQGFQENEYDDY